MPNPQRGIPEQSRDVGTVLGLVTGQHLRAAAGHSVAALPAASPQSAPPDTVDVQWVSSRAAAIERKPECYDELAVRYEATAHVGTIDTWLRHLSNRL